MVSVILVNYNGSQDTISCIESVKESNNKDYRVIVVDNNSSDDSYDYLNGMKEKFGFLLLRARENRGFSAGNNLGIKKAIELGTDYIWLLNNDTIITSTTIDELIQGFNFSSRCGATIGKILYERNRDVIWYAGGSIDLTTARTEHWKYNEKNTDGSIKKALVSFATGCSLFMSYNAFEKIGFLDEDYFLYEEDADYSIRFIETGVDMVYCPEAIIYHKVSSSTGIASPNTQFYMVRNKFLLIQKHYRGLRKAIAYLYNVAQMAFRCVKGQLSFRCFIKGFSAFLKKEKGKRVGNL